MPALVPRDLDFADTAPLRVFTVVTVTGTADEVWAVLVDNPRWPEWFADAKACRSTSEPPPGVGSTRWIHVDLFKVNELFIAWEPPTLWAFTIRDANLPGFHSVVERAELEALDGGRVRITYTMAVELKVWMRPLTPILRWKFRRLFARSLAGMDTQLAKVRSEAA